MSKDKKPEQCRFPWSHVWGEWHSLRELLRGDTEKIVGYVQFRKCTRCNKTEVAKQLIN